MSRPELNNAANSLLAAQTPAGLGTKHRWGCVLLGSGSSLGWDPLRAYV